MDNVIGILLTQILHGGPEIIALLVFIICLLIVDRTRLTSEITRKDERLAKIVDDYYRGNLTLAEAMNSLKVVLYEIKVKM